MQWPDHFVGLSLGKAYPELGAKVMLTRNLAQTFWTFKIRSLVIALSSAMNPQDACSIKLEQPLEAVGRLSPTKNGLDLQGVPLVSNGRRAWKRFGQKAACDPDL